MKQDTKLTGKQLKTLITNEMVDDGLLPHVPGDEEEKDQDKEPGQVVTSSRLKQLIKDVMREYEGSLPYQNEPLLAEPPVNNPNQHPPLSEKVVRSYKGTKITTFPGKARYYLRLCSDEERDAIFKEYGRQTYQQFLSAIEAYESAKKPKK